jgi:hypothetical protein
VQQQAGEGIEDLRVRVGRRRQQVFLAGEVLVERSGGASGRGGAVGDLGVQV